MAPSKAFINNNSQATKNALDTRKSFVEDIQKPLGNNSVRSLGLLFSDREYYQNTIIPYISSFFQEKAIFADLLGKHSLYGLIDKELNILLPDESNMKELPSGNEDRQYAMDFVVDAFQEMNAYLISAVIMGKLSKDSPYYNLKVYNSYLDPRVQKNDIQRRIVTDFKKRIINDMSFSYKIKDAKSFNKYFLLTLKDLIKDGYPVSKSATVLKGNFLTFSSGLIIDFAKDKADNDLIKFDKYLSKEDFLVFAEACKRFGFMIDQNVPWRIIADLSSPAMLENTGTHLGYMFRKGISSVDDLFAKRYSKIALDEIYHLKSFFLDSYNSLLRDYPYYEVDYKKLQGCEFNNQTIFKREEITPINYFLEFKDDYWMRVFVYLRNYEEKRGLTQIDFENLVREANNFVFAGKTLNALIYANNYFKKFDRVKYFSSLQNRNKTLEQIVQSSTIPELVF